MQCVPLSLFVILLFHPALSFLPTPINVHMDSLNFRYILRWDPGPGTPPETQYLIYRRETVKRTKTFNSTRTFLRLRLDRDKRFTFSVQAFLNETKSQMSNSILFIPMDDTTIGPPVVSLAGCGNCIQVNVSMPEPDRRSGINDILDFYNGNLQVSWKKSNDSKQPQLTTTNSKNFTLSNLERGQKYCVQVQPITHLNKNTHPSAWTCAFTSTVEPSRVSAILVAVAALLIAGIIIGMSLLLCLCYAGCLCPPKEKLPLVLEASVIQGPELVMERTTDVISRVSETDKAKTRRDHPVTGLSNHQEKTYSVKGVGNVPAQISRGNGNYTSGHMTESVDWTGSTASFSEPDAETQAPAEARTAAVDLAVRDGREDSQEMVFSGCDTVDLFSVTLAAIAASDQEEERPFDSLLDMEPLLRNTPDHTSPHTDFFLTASPTRSTQDVKEERGYARRPAGISDTFDVEEEVECSAYQSR